MSNLALPMQAVKLELTIHVQHITQYDDLGVSLDEYRFLLNGYDISYALSEDDKQIIMEKAS